MAVRLSGWPGEELLWHGLYVEALRRAILILLLFCRWGMQTGVRISSEYLKAFWLPLTTTHCDFIIFCDFQNYTSNIQNAISAYFASRFY